MQLRRDYQSAYPHCQITAAVGQYVRLPKLGSELCVHHIWGRKGRYSEHWANYVTALPGPHTEWAHGNETTARIAMTAYKLHLDRKDGGHFDAAALKRGFGQHVLPWIEWKLETETVPEWCRWLWERTGAAWPHERR